MIHLSQIRKSFPDKILFEGLDLVIKRGVRAGLVGPNGSGKTTLLRMIMGEDEPEQGQIHLERQLSIGYLPQEITGSSDQTILMEVLDEFPEVAELEQAIEKLSEEISRHPDDRQLLDRLGRYQAEFERLDGWSIESQAKKVLGGLGFRAEQMKQPLNQFSGGWRMRVALAKLLFRKPDILLLDEPTNHLDLLSLIWLENFLREWTGALVLISHDRMFLDKTVNEIFEIHHHKVQSFSGNYSHYLQEKQLRQEQQEAAYGNQQKLIEETQRFIDRFRYKESKAKQVQSRIKALEKLERIAPPEGRQSHIRVRIPQAGRAPRILAELRNAGKSYGSLEVFRHLNLQIERGQKIGLVGPNGAGKSTLLKMLAGVEQLSAGELSWGEGVSRAYFAQHQFEALPQESSLHKLISDAAPQWTQTEIRTYLGSFLFSGEAIDKPIKVLSGGEVSRLALAKMLASPRQLILLDEPTNHLDMLSRDVVQEAIAGFSGTMVCISHDRHFLNAVTDQMIEVNAGELSIYPGNYEYYLWRKEQQGSETETQRRSISNEKQDRGAALDYAERKRQTNRLKKLPRLIESCEQDLQEQERILNLPETQTDYARIENLLTQKEVLENQYLALLEEQEKLERDLE